MGGGEGGGYRSFCFWLCIFKMSLQGSYYFTVLFFVAPGVEGCGYSQEPSATHCKSVKAKLSTKGVRVCDLEESSCADSLPSLVNVALSSHLYQPPARLPATCSFLPDGVL